MKTFIISSFFVANSIAFAAWKASDCKISDLIEGGHHLIGVVDKGISHKKGLNSHIAVLPGGPYETPLEAVGALQGYVDSGHCSTDYMMTTDEKTRFLAALVQAKPQLEGAKVSFLYVKRQSSFWIVEIIAIPGTDGFSGPTMMALIFNDESNTVFDNSPI